MTIIDDSRRMLLLSMVIYLQYTKAQNRPCTNNAAVLQTCSGKRLTGRKIDVYHTNLQNLTYNETCRCTVTANQGDSIRIQVTEVPGIINCGTNISIFKPDGSITPVHCRNRLGLVSNIQLRANDKISLVFFTVANYSTSSAFCMFIHESNYGSINVACSSRLLLNESQDSLSSTKETATEITSSTVSLESKCASTSKPVSIVMAAVLGVIVLVLLIIVAVLCRRLRKHSGHKEEQTVQYVNNIQLPTPLPVYEQLAAGNQDERGDNTYYESLQNS